MVAVEDQAGRGHDPEMSAVDLERLLDHSETVVGQAEASFAVAAVIRQAWDSY